MKKFEYSTIAKIQHLSFDFMHHIRLSSNSITRKVSNIVHLNKEENWKIECQKSYQILIIINSYIPATLPNPMVFWIQRLLQTYQRRDLSAARQILTNEISFPVEA